jgi:xylan 1,4-beta-xylosidase
VSTGMVNLRFSGVQPGTYQLQVRRTGFRANDAHTAYLEMGSPADLTPQQLSELQRQTEDRPERQEAVTVPASGTIELNLPIKSNDIILVELVPATDWPNRR